MIINSSINKGSSLPVVLQDNGQKYFVKLSDGMSGANSMINEWIGNTLGNLLKINTQVPKWITIDTEVEIVDVNIEVKDLIEKSMGRNIGFDFIEDAKEIKAKGLANLDAKQLEEMFLLDLLLINIDRTSNNTNLMKVDKELYSVDYESCLLFQDCIGNRNLLQQESILQCFRNSPLYVDISITTLNTFIKKVKVLSSEKLIAEIPDSILSQEKRTSFLNGWEDKKANSWNLSEAIIRLSAMQPETKETLKVRANENQAKFKRHFSQNKKRNKQ